MERLTCIDLRDSENMGGYCVKHPEKTKTIDLINRLAHYEDLAEQGRLVELPCKVGDAVYRIVKHRTKCTVHNQEFDYYSCQGCETYDCDSKVCYKVEEFKPMRLDVIVDRVMEHIGKTVFLTRSEAEQALAERKE